MNGGAEFISELHSLRYWLFWQQRIELSMPRVLLKQKRNAKKRAEHLRATQGIEGVAYRRRS